MSRGIETLYPGGKKMTVEKVKKLRTVASKKSSNFDLKSLDNLIQSIDTLKSEEQVPEFLENEALLSKSFKCLLSLISKEGCADSEDLFDESLVKIDENVMEMMSKLLDADEIDEEEFEDFFTEELDEEDEDEEMSEFDISEEEDMNEDESKIKPVSKSKSKHLKELEMLMEKVEDESDLDEDEYESEDEEEAEHEKDEEGNSEEGYSEDENIFETTKTGGKKDILNDEEEEGISGRLSSFERSQASLKNQIAVLESENIESGKPWSLRGEINARQRPSDSLLEEAVDFDNLSRPVPQITEERSEEIEDVIKRRILEAAWDDVERKDGRDLTLLNGMSKDKQKSARALLEDVATANPQRSLSQVYEDEANTKLSGSSAVDEETREKQVELTALFAKICRHVDGLSGNRFAPKVYAQSDFQIKTLGKK